MKTRSKTRSKNRSKHRSKQLGGQLTIKLDEWTKISNSGSYNCGIFVSDKYPTLILKCVTRSKISSINTTNQINKFLQLFVNVYDEQEINGKFYIIMQKFKGDITSIFHYHFPNIVLNDMIDKGIIDKIQKDNILKSAFNSRINLNIEKQIYDIFIENLFKLWNKYYEIICKEVAKIQLLLVELGYFYGDIKFDNIGYILSNTPILTDYRAYNAPKIFNQYLYVYFIDIDGGYNKINVNANSSLSTYTFAFEEILDNINNGFSKYLLGRPRPYTSSKLYENNIKKYTNINEVEQYLFGNNNTLNILKKFLNIEAPYFLLKKQLQEKQNSLPIDIESGFGGIIYSDKNLIEIERNEKVINETFKKIVDQEKVLGQHYFNNNG